MSFYNEPEEEWMKKARCLDADPEAFFPDKGQPSTAAKAVCALCPVSEECLEFAVRTDQRFGVWGGCSEPEIRRIRRRSRGSVHSQRPRD